MTTHFFELVGKKLNALWRDRDQITMEDWIFVINPEDIIERNAKEQWCTVYVPKSHVPSGGFIKPF